MMRSKDRGIVVTLRLIEVVIVRYLVREFLLDVSVLGGIGRHPSSFRCFCGQGNGAVNGMIEAYPRYVGLV